MVDSTSITLRDVMKEDISLGNSGASNCWTRQMKDVKQITVTTKYKTQHNNLHAVCSLLKNDFKPGSSLSRAKAGNCTTDCNSPDTLSLSLLFLKSDLLDTLSILYHTH